MDIWTKNQLALCVAFAIPGFIALKTYSIIQPAAQREASQQLVDAVTYSCVNYAILGVPIYWVHKFKLMDTCPGFTLLFAVFVVLLAPALVAVLFARLRASKYFQKFAPHPTSDAWDFVFSQRKPYWMIVSLRAGEKIAGRYDSSSFASSAPAARQLYLQEAWQMSADGGFELMPASTNLSRAFGASRFPAA
ncbi:MAG: hypothetical protein RJA70_4320 [Pseudomonadota bacterium]|jgi:hypothetical protein